MRPSEPTRSTLPRWIATCRGCGACGPDLACLPEAAREVVAAPAYRALPGPTAAAAFLRWAMICEAAGAMADAADARLQAAWAADDAGDAAAGILWRQEAARLWGSPADIATRLRLIEVLRRAGDFAGAERWIVTLRADPRLEETDTRILAFQQTLLTQRDTRRQSIASALRPPARTPHVAHGRAPAGKSVWRRLFGR